ncbi:MAG: hypothetical protein GX575_15615 [Candidatus Anammoximicrobium sp.]|nr:hypothetical protein [Candidatus Anammoximicrobium sp.]
MIVLKDGRVLSEFPTRQFRDLHELAAALWPASSAARAEPLRLLQEGRTAL